MGRGRLGLPVESGMAVLLVPCIAAVWPRAGRWRVLFDVGEEVGAD